MFQKNDKVVLSGIHASRTGFNSFHYGTTTLMECWEADKTLLSVASASSAIRVQATDGAVIHSFHPSELRYATPAEIDAASKPETPKFQRGDVVRLTDGRVGMVTHAKPDGDLRILIVDAHISGYFKPEAVATLLAHVDASGVTLVSENFVPCDGETPGKGWELTPEPKPPALQRGSVVVLNNGAIGIVQRPTPDSDGEYTAHFANGHTPIWFKATDIARVTGHIGEDGTLVPTTHETKADDSDPTTWRVGDVLQCIDSSDSHLREQCLYLLHDKVVDARGQIPVSGWGVVNKHHPASRFVLYARKGD